jgi:hypothetical protein
MPAARRRPRGVARGAVGGYKSGLHVGIDREVRVTRPHHGSPRTEVSDLRNIVDRLDLLMGGPGPGSGHGVASPRDEAIAALRERVEALEGEVDELRTLVNHLMTIAAWQAKVTAALVDDRADLDVDDDIEPTRPEPQYGGAGQPSANERQRDDDSTQAPHRSQAPATMLDDDIDEILGSDRRGPHHDPAPPDFGI